MKKILVLLVLFFVSFVLSACSLFEPTYNQEEVDSIISQMEERIAYLESANAVYEEAFEDFGGVENFANDFDDWEDFVSRRLEETPYERFLSYVLSEEYCFIQLDTEYSEVVESYGYSKTYVYELTKPGMFVITMNVDNDLDLTYYVNYSSQNDWGETLTITPSLFGFSRTVEFYVDSSFLVFDFESWDEENDSEIVFYVSFTSEE